MLAFLPFPFDRRAYISQEPFCFRIHGSIRFDQFHKRMQASLGVAIFLLTVPPRRPKCRQSAAPGSPPNRSASLAAFIAGFDHLDWPTLRIWSEC